MAGTITPQIVIVNTTVTSAPAVNTLQQQGAIVSTGGTTLASGTSQYVSSVADAQSILAAPLAITSLAWAAGEVTVTVAENAELTAGDTFAVNIAGAVPAAYNGTFTATVTTAGTAFTYPLVVDPGTATTEGTYTGPGAAFVANALASFFAAGNTVGVSLLELGAQSSPNAGVAALSTWIADQSPQPFYAYLVDPVWDASESSALATLAKAYEAPTAQTYFFISTTSSNISAYASIKSVFALVPSPNAPLSEVSCAAAFEQWLSNDPSPANVLMPMTYRFVPGTTPWPASGQSSAVDAILTASGNLIMSGSQGGLQASVLFGGTLMDGNDGTFWYGIDYVRIQIAQALAAAVINGANS